MEDSEEQREIRINIPTMEDSTKKILMNRKNRETARKTFAKIAAFNINYLIRLQRPEIMTDYPDFPDDLPRSLLFNPTKKYNKDGSNSQKSVKKEDPAIMEAKSFIANIKHQRRSRYSGSYEYVEQLPVVKFKKVKNLPPVTLPVAPPVKLASPTPHIKRSREFSSSSSSCSSPKNENVKIKSIKKKMKTLSESSSTESEPEAKTVDPLPVPVKKIIPPLPPSPKKVVAIPPAVKPKTMAFKKSSTVTSSQKAKMNYVAPPIIAPPALDPKTGRIPKVCNIKHQRHL